MSRRVLLVLLLLTIASTPKDQNLAAATPVAGPQNFVPIPVFVQELENKEVGQGFLVRNNLGCVVLTPGHVMKTSLEADIRGQAGYRALGSIISSDPDVDFSILEVNPALGDCATVAASPSQVDEAMAAESVYMLTRSPTGNINRIELSPVSADTRHILLRPLRGADVRSGMSGAPIIFRGAVIAMEISVSGTGAEARVKALRMDYVARVAGALLDASAPVPQRIPKPASTISSPSAITTGEGKFSWPVQGIIVSDFSSGKAGGFNRGIDIVSTSGADVYAAADGIVAYAGTQGPVFGGLILITHSDGVITAYGNLADLSVQRGQRVKQGQVIGHVAGNEKGEANGVHFEVRRERSAVDPLNFLGQRSMSLSHREKEVAFDAQPIDNDQGPSTVNSTVGTETGPQQTAAFEPATEEEITRLKAYMRSAPPIEMDNAVAQFLGKHEQEEPSSEIALNASDILLTNNMPARAAVRAFDNYSKRPQGHYAPESLVVLTEAFLKLDKKPDACKVVAEFDDVFPGSSLLHRYALRFATARTRAQCP